jgi:biotin carboxyl carrier protein
VKFSFEQHAQAFSLELTPAGSGKSYRATIRDQTLQVELLRATEGKLDLLIDGQRVTAYVASNNAMRWVTINGQTFVLTKSSGARQGGRGHQRAAGALRVTAPMPGQIRAVNVNQGENVTKGQTLLVLEAMKMEIRVQAPQDAVVKKVLVEQGQTVEREQLLIEIE